MGWTPEELAQKLKENPDLRLGSLKLGGGAITCTGETSAAQPELPVSKYRSRRTPYNGVLYDSKKEADFAQSLDLEQKAGVILFWLRQVPFELPGNVKYRLDFMVFYPGGKVRYFRVKGIDRKTGKIVTQTAASRMKERQIEALYPVSIELV